MDVPPYGLHVVIFVFPSRPPEIPYCRTNQEEEAGASALRQLLFTVIQSLLEGFIHDFVYAAFLDGLLDVVAFYLQCGPVQFGDFPDHFWPIQPLGSPLIQSGLKEPAILIHKLIDRDLIVLVHDLFDFV